MWKLEQTASRSAFVRQRGSEVLCPPIHRPPTSQPEDVDVDARDGERVDDNDAADRRSIPAEPTRPDHRPAERPLDTP